MATSLTLTIAESVTYSTGQTGKTASPTPTIAESVVTDSTGQTAKIASSTPTIAESEVTDSTVQTGKTKWLPHPHQLVLNQWSQAIQVTFVVINQNMGMAL